MGKMKFQLKFLKFHLRFLKFEYSDKKPPNPKTGNDDKYPATDYVYTALPIDDLKKVTSISIEKEVE